MGQKLLLVVAVALAVVATGCNTTDSSSSPDDNPLFKVGIKRERDACKDRIEFMKSENWEFSCRQGGLRSVTESH